jgi:hypothetical protein
MADHPAGGGLRGLRLHIPNVGKYQHHEPKHRQEDGRFHWHGNLLAFKIRRRYESREISEWDVDERPDGDAISLPGFDHEYGDP